MLLDERRELQKIIPKLQRVLIVDPQPAAARVLSDLMRTLGRSQVLTAETTVKALEVASKFNPQIIFVELAGPDVDGCKFTRALRRSDYECRGAPVIIVTGSPTAAGIINARDAGVHEFLRKPFTTKDIIRRLQAVTLHDRMWVEAMKYVGPDRRRFNSGEYKGPRKRQSDPTAMTVAERITQAVQILKSAVEGLSGDPVQALRSMQAQVVELQQAATEGGDTRLGACVAAFRAYLEQAAGKPLNAAEVATQAKPLMAFEAAAAKAA